MLTEIKSGRDNEDEEGKLLSVRCPACLESSKARERNERKMASKRKRRRKEVEMKKKED